ncbi:hypothetical protein SNE40_022734 [Patella caerulea]|uniref:C-type lectin n=1 Tax=Patella caerulea TaxID=87958 RepID=A0AAN8G608_PATCE
MTRLIVLLLIVAVNQTRGSCPEYVFKKISFNSRLVLDYLQKYVDLSVKECAERCSEVPNCSSFSYKPETTNNSECYTYNKRIWSGIASTQYDYLSTYWRLADSCPADYIYNRTYNVCYKKYAEQLMAWGDAMDLCEQDGGYLFIGNTMDKLQLLNDYFMSLPPPLITVAHYIGGNDFQQEGIWEWLDGSKTFNWPRSGAEPSGGTSENCTGVKPKESGIISFFDMNCYLMRPFVCEVPLRP